VLKTKVSVSDLPKKKRFCPLHLGMHFLDTGIRGMSLLGKKNNKKRLFGGLPSTVFWKTIFLSELCSTSFQSPLARHRPGGSISR
jgi:hypothetical protein